MAFLDQRDLTQDSDEVHEMHCEQCEEYDETEVAEGFCINCLEYMCKSCLKYHARQNKQHKVQDREAMPQDFCFERCAGHLNKFIRFYCDACETFACIECRKLYHTACTDIQHVPTMAKGIERSGEFLELRKELGRISEELAKTESKLNTSITETDLQEKQFIETIDKRRKDRKEHFEKQKNRLVETFYEYQKNVITQIQKEKQEQSDLLDNEQTMFELNLRTREKKIIERLERNSLAHITKLRSRLADCSSLINDNKSKSLDLDAKQEAGLRCKLLMALKAVVSDLRKQKQKLLDLLRETEEMALGHQDVGEITASDVSMTQNSMIFPDFSEERLEIIQHILGPNRLSEQVSVKLRDNNPNIVDFSDQCRPTKLAEMFSELYDNEWNNAFFALEDTFTEEQTIVILLDIVMIAYEFCEERVNEPWQTLVDWFLDELSIQNLPGAQQTTKWLKDSRKTNIQKKVPVIEKNFSETILSICVNENLEQFLGDNDIKIYFTKCIELCLLMVATDPPVVLVCPGWKASPSPQKDGTKTNENPREEKTVSEESEKEIFSQIESIKVRDNNQHTRGIDEKASADEAETSGVDELQDETEKSCKNQDINEGTESLPNDTEDPQEGLLYSYDNSFDVADTKEDTVDNIGEDKNVHLSLETVRNKTDTNENNDVPGDSPINDQHNNANAKAANDEMEQATPVIDEKRLLFDKELFKEYTRRGKYLDYIVWPAMCLYKDGPLLHKGVAQGRKYQNAVQNGSGWTWRSSK